jgi:hypothetical protein
MTDTSKLPAGQFLRYADIVPSMKLRYVGSAAMQFLERSLKPGETVIVLGRGHVHVDDFTETWFLLASFGKVEVFSYELQRLFEEE